MNCFLKKIVCHCLTYRVVAPKETHLRMNNSPAPDDLYTLQEKIGKGSFGEVWKGFVESRSGGVGLTNIR